MEGVDSMLDCPGMFVAATPTSKHSETYHVVTVSPLVPANGHHARVGGCSSAC